MEQLNYEKKVTCDFCGAQEIISHATNWHRLKLDSRNRGNIGGMVWRFEICADCYKGGFYGTGPEALAFLKSLRSLP